MDKSTEDDGFRGLYALNQTRFPPLSIPKAMANAGASRISLEYGITGPVYTISTACSSANHAIGQAFWMVRNGAAEIAHRRRKRGSIFTRSAESLGSDARGFPGHLPPVFAATAAA